MLVPKRPTHNKYLFSKVDDKTYTLLCERYILCKKIGIKGAFGFATSAGVVEIIREYASGKVRSWAHQKFCALITGACIYAIGPSAAVLTNSTKIIKALRSAHAGCAFCAECLEDTANLPLISLDYALFGRKIPIGEDGRYNWMTNSSDFLNF